MEADDRKAFIERIESTYSEKVLDMQIAELRATNKVYNELNLKLHYADPSLWGLVIICQNNLLFYVAEKSSYLSIFTQKNEGEQMISLKNVNELYFSQPPKKKFNLLFPELSRTLIGKFKSSDDHYLTFELIFNQKTDSFYPSLEKALVS